MPEGAPASRSGRPPGRPGRICAEPGGRAIFFFDVGDTLVERVDDPAHALLLVLGRQGSVAGSALAAMQHAYLAGVYAPSTLRGERGLWRALAEVCAGHLPDALDGREVRRLVRDLAGYAAHYRPVAGMVDLITELRAGGRSVGIISNWPPSLPQLLEQLGYGRFPIVACSGRLRCTKPDPAIFLWALRRAGIPAAEAWYVGNDFAADYAPAAALGMRAVLWDPAGRGDARAARRAASASQLRRLLLAGA